MTTDGVQPGDFAVISTGSRAGPWIRFGEWANGDGFGIYDHAVICVDATAERLGTPRIVEAQPGGAVLTGWHYESRPHLWSTGKVATSRAAALAALKYVGVPYSFLDYAALAAHRLHIPAPGLQSYIASTGHMICSQLVDQAEADAGIHLFRDRRWSGYVTPMALAGLLGAGSETR